VTPPEASREGRRRGRGRGGTPRKLRIRRWFGFAVAVLITLVLAFNGGGYDVVVRHEVGLALWAAIALGLGVGLLPRSRLSPAAWTALGGFAALAGLTLLSQTWTRSPEHSTAELARVLQYGALVVLAYLTLNRYTWRGAALGFATGALVVPFFAVGSRLFPDLLHDQIDALGTDRLSYPLDYWNAVACWGAMAIGVGLTLGANASRPALRGVALATVPVAALSVYLTYSRFGVAAVVIAVIAAIALSKHRWTAALNGLVAGAGSAVLILVARGHDEIARATGDAGAGSVFGTWVIVGGICALAAVATMQLRLDRVRMELRSARLALGALAVVGLVAAVALSGPLGDAWDEFKNDKPPPATGGTERLTTFGSTRYDVWSSAVDAFKSEPLRGIGPGTFEYYWAKQGQPEFARDAHSLYLEEAAELGLPGLLALLVGLGGLLWAALAARIGWGRRREIAAGSAVIAAFVVFLAYAGVDWMWEMGAVGTLAIGGVAVAGAGGLDRSQPSSLGPWMRALAVVGALLAGAVQLPGLVSTQRVRASEAELANGNPARAKELANQAIAAEDWAATPYAARALASEALGDLRGARRDAQQAVDRDPDNWRDHLILARIEAELHRRGAARAQVAEARRLAPSIFYLNPDAPYVKQLNRLLGVGASPPVSGGP
jgi:tetratricopeptide (TPR) repeat protein